MEQKKVSDGDLIVGALVKHQGAKYAWDSLSWDESKFNKVIKDHNIDVNSVLRNSGDIGIATAMNQQLARLREKIVPKKWIDRIKYILKMAKEEDLFNYIISTKIDFLVEGFHVQTKGKADQKKINEFNTKFDMDAVVLALAKYLVPLEGMALQWKGNKNSIKWVKAPDPRTTVYIPLDEVDDKGKPKFDAFRQSATHGYNELRTLTNSRKGGYNKMKWEPIDLNKEPILIRTIDGYRDRLIEPSAVSILPELTLRRLLVDGYTTVAYHIKWMIHQIKIGDKDYNKKTAFYGGVKSGAPPTKDECISMLDDYKKDDKSAVEVTDVFREHKFISPPHEYLDGEHLESPEYRIMRWGKVLPYARPSGTTYAGGYNEAKPLQAEIRKYRKLLRRILEEFYREAVGVEKVDIMFDNYNLMEVKQMISILQTATGRWGVSVKTAREAFGFHDEYETTQHRVEAKHKEDYEPPFEESQGLLNDGRPEKDDSDPDNETNVKTTPRPKD